MAFSKSFIPKISNTGDAFRVAMSSGTYGLEEAPGCQVRYLWQLFDREPVWTEESVNHSWQKLWRQGQEPDEL